MARQPRYPRSLLLAELVVSLMAVILFGLAYPDRFRSRLWENGGEQGWNSDPTKRIYFYANHQEPPEVPLLWKQRLTDSNFAIAILSLFICFIRAIATFHSYLPRAAGIFYDVLLLWLWTVSLVGQTSGDLSDPEHLSPRPWYLTHGCAVALDKNRSYCRIAQASFAVSILAAVLYGVRLLREALLVAYQKGRKDERQLLAQDVDQELGFKYTDDETQSVTGLAKEEEKWKDMALSPVLAFFPSAHGH